MHIYKLVLFWGRPRYGPRYFRIILIIYLRQHTWIAWLEFSLWICLRSLDYEKKKKKLKIFTKWHINWTSIPSDYCQLAVWLLPAWQLLQMYSTTNSIPNRVEPYLIVMVTINMVISKLQSIYSCSVLKGRKSSAPHFSAICIRVLLLLGAPTCCLSFSLTSTHYCTSFSFPLSLSLSLLTCFNKHDRDCHSTLGYNFMVCNFMSCH